MNALLLAGKTNYFPSPLWLCLLETIKRNMLLKVLFPVMYIRGRCLRRSIIPSTNVNVVCWVTIQNKAKTSCIMKDLLFMINSPRLFLCKGLAHPLCSLMNMIHKKNTNINVLGKTSKNRVKGRHGCLFNEIWLV